MAGREGASRVFVSENIREGEHFLRKNKGAGRLYRENFTKTRPKEVSGKKRELFNATF